MREERDGHEQRMHRGRKLRERCEALEQRVRVYDEATRSLDQAGRVRELEHKCARHQQAGRVRELEHKCARHQQAGRVREL
eukprot:gene23801-52879_t